MLEGYCFYHGQGVVFQWLMGVATSCCFVLRGFFAIYTAIELRIELLVVPRRQSM